MQSADRAEVVTEDHITAAMERAATRLRAGSIARPGRGAALSPPPGVGQASDSLLDRGMRRGCVDFGGKAL